MDEEPEVTPVRSRSSRDLPCIANRDIHPRRKRQAVIDDYDYETSEEDGQVSLKSDEDPLSEEVSSSDVGGHDYRQPRRRTSSKFFSASDWTTKEWKIVLASGNISDPDAASEDDGKPCFRTKPSRCKAKWSSGLGHKQVKAGVRMLQDQEAALEFKSLELPECISYLGPKLMKGKAFEEAELRANTAGTCGLAALTCAESTRAFANKINSACKAPLLPLHGASQEDIDEIRRTFVDIRQDVAAWKSQIKNASDEGAKMAAGIFNKETESIRQLMAKSSDLSPINSILLPFPPQTLLFSDSDKKIAKAMEAADRHWPYPPKSTFTRSSGHK
jgi:hypothetical protein